MRSPVVYRFFFFNDTATTEIYTLSLHDALPISLRATVHACASSSPIGPRAPNRPPVRLRDVGGPPPCARRKVDEAAAPLRSEEHTSELQSQSNLVCRLLLEKKNNSCRIDRVDGA